MLRHIPAGLLALRGLVPGLHTHVFMLRLSDLPVGGCL